MAEMPRLATPFEVATLAVTGRLPEEDEPTCIHAVVTLRYAPPGGRWACDECGQRFHPVEMTCVTPS